VTHGAPATVRDRLDLADWRRRVAALYVEVRALAATDFVAAHAHWRAAREQLFREHPQSPVPAEVRAAFAAAHWPYDASLRFEVALEPPPDPAPGALPLELPNSGADALAFFPIGSVDVPFREGSRTLSVFWIEGYTGGLFVPFRDATNGRETYAAGRYVLDTAKSADLGSDPARGTIALDFNFSYHPSCAFDPRWSCPLAPPENRLDLAIRAGERIA
jgi:uncharacterized protein